MAGLSFTLNGTAYIELIRLLKFVGIAENGAHAQMLVEQGMVERNGEIETRKRAKLRAGDRIRVGDTEVVVNA